MNPDPFHPGERLVQARAGVQLRGAPIRDFMPEQHRVFFAGLPALFVGVADESGAPVATALTGPPGFVSSPDFMTLRIDAPPDANDPAAQALREGAEIGLLGLDFATRRRNRANGVLLARDDAGLTAGIRQSFGNCPQYIHPRWPDPAPPGPGAVQALSGLDAHAGGLIAAADTFFVASSSGAEGGAHGGVDMSHRGGPRGFVRVEGDRLVIPDYRGNRYFNTLGNLALDPRAALLFVDFATGGLLHLQGTAVIEWGAAGVAAWSVLIDRAWWRPGALPWRWSPGQDAA